MYVEVRAKRGLGPFSGNLTRLKVYCRWELLICICFGSALPRTEEGRVSLYGFCVGVCVFSEVPGLAASLVQGREC